MNTTDSSAATTRHASRISSGPWRRKTALAAITALGILIGAADTAAGEIERYPFEATKGDSISEFISHARLLSETVETAVESLLTGFTFSRPRPVWIAPAAAGDTNHWVFDAITRELFARGHVIYDIPREDSVQRHWELRYRLDDIGLALPEVRRHAFLGRIWVKRASHATVKADLWDRETGELIWKGAGESRIADWVPKRDLPRLSSGSDPVTLHPPPKTASERYAEPVIITAAVGALTVLFFAVR